MNDRIFQELAASYPMHMVWRVGLVDMWLELEKELGRNIVFLTESEREALRATP